MDGSLKEMHGKILMRNKHYISSQTELVSQMNKCTEVNFSSIKNDKFSVREPSNVCQLGGQ